MKFIKYILSIIILGLFSVQNAAALTPPNISSQCPTELQLTENLRSGAYNGIYHPYTGKIVTQAHLLQRHLNRLGFSSGIEDGKLGPISTAAIQRMQLSLGTNPDGIVGPLTRAVINDSCQSDDYIPPICETFAYDCVAHSESRPLIQTTDVSLDESAYLFSFRGEHSYSSYSDSVKVFFVYGTDSDIYNIEEEYDNFSEIPDNSRITKSGSTGWSTGGGFADSISPSLIDFEKKYYYVACAEYQNSDHEKDLSCGKVKTFDYSGDLERANIQGADVRMQVKISEGRSIAELHMINTGSYDGAIQEINNISTNFGIYKLVYSTNPNWFGTSAGYTYYFKLKSKEETIFCADSTGFIGEIENLNNPYRLGIACNS